MGAPSPQDQDVFSLGLQHLPGTGGFAECIRCLLQSTSTGQGLTSRLVPAGSPQGIKDLSIGQACKTPAKALSAEREREHDGVAEDRAGELFADSCTENTGIFHLPCKQCLVFKLL